jgi:hypothetical protein
LTFAILSVGVYTWNIFLGRFGHQKEGGKWKMNLRKKERKKDVKNILWIWMIVGEKYNLLYGGLNWNESLSGIITFMNCIREINEFYDFWFLLRFSMIEGQSSYWNKIFAKL